MNKSISEWQKLPLNVFCKRIRRNSNKDIKDVLTISSTQGWVDQKKKWARNMAGKSIEKYVLLRQGEFSYNKGNSKTYPQGCVFRLDRWDEALVPNVYHSFCINSEIVNSDFLQHFFASGGLNNQLRTVITSSVRNNGLLNITAEEFFKKEVNLPPLPEQKKIAEILSAIDNKISISCDMKSKCESIGKALINNFLKNVFSDGSNRRIVTLGSVTEMRGRIGWKGYTKEDLVDTGALVLGGTQISRSNEIDLSKPVYISDYKYEESPEIMVNNGDLILVKTGNTIGKIALVPNWNRRATINPNTIILRANNGLNRYLLLLLSSETYQKKIWDLVAIGAQPSVNQANLKALEIPLIESGKIESLCDSFDLISSVAKIYGKRIALLTHLKKGVAADLLSGRKRIKV